MKQEDSSDAAVLDFDQFLDRLGGDSDLVRELVALYIEEYPRQLSDLQSAVASRDLKLVQRAAHKIKGTARNFAAGPAEKSARALEETKEFGDGMEISVMMNRLAHELRRLQSALEEVLTRLP